MCAQLSLYLRTGVVGRGVEVGEQRSQVEKQGYWCHWGGWEGGGEGGHS